MLSDNLPGLRLVRHYQMSWLRGDVVAGVVLAAYLLPAGIGDASLAGLPPEAGLYSCLFAGLVFWLFCSSRHTAITVTSAISLLIGASLAPMSNGDADRHAALAACTTLLVAVIAFVAWMVKAGTIVNFISEPVMIGFKCGVALFLASSQLPKLFGFKGGHGDFWERSGHFLSPLDQTNTAALLTGLVALAVLILGKIFLQNKPVGLFVVIDLTTANVVEPRVYGSSTGVSPIAILLSAMFWATLWGPVGLILATPMTVCLVVIGRYIPQFQVLETLLGSEPVLEPPERLYQRMLKGNVEEAIEIAEEIVEEVGLDTFHDNVFLSALRLASDELSDSSEALAQRRVLTGSIGAVIKELGEAEPLEGSAVVLIGGRTEIDESAAKVVAQRLAVRGVPSRILPPMAVRQESIGRIDLEGAEVVCLFYFGTEIKAQTRYVSRRLKLIRPGLKVLVCQLDTEAPASSAEALRVDNLTNNLPGVLEEIDGYLDVATAAAKLAGHQPFRGAGRGDDALGRALETVAEKMGVPLATINLLDDERHRGEEGAYKLTEMIAERGAALVIHPGTADENLAENPYLQSNGVDFYAGVPLTLKNGLTVGSLVIIDYEEHEFGDEELAKLQTLATELVERFGDGAGQPTVAAKVSSQEGLLQTS